MLERIAGMKPGVDGMGVPRGLLGLMVVGLVLGLAGCGSARAPVVASDGGVGQRPMVPAQQGTGYYKDDGPGDYVPADLDKVADANPQAEPLHRFANRPYTVFGQRYVPSSTRTPYKEQGRASWYGKKFHGQKTSSGEIYDMFEMTAAHRTLPIPSYAVVTSLDNGRAVVVRINDRGPFHADRIVDLSYAAAHRLGYIQKGSTRVEVEAVQPLPDGSYPSAQQILAARGVSSPAVTAKTTPTRVATAEVVTRDTVAAPAPAAPAPPSPAPVAVAVAAPTTSEGGHFVQLGAFASMGNAESLKTRIGQELTELAHRLQVASSGGLFRVHLGPYASPDEARTVLTRLEQQLNLKGVLVSR